MKIMMKSNDTMGFTEAVRGMQKTLKGIWEGTTWIYKTDKGTYTFYFDYISNGYIQFEGKRLSFGKSLYFKIWRAKKFFGKDKLKMAVGDRDFEMQVTHFESSASNKPFWANCSKKDYRALQKLLAH